MNTDAIILRLEKIRQYYDLSAAAFADKMNIQRSTISHLLKGRNKPSLEFVLKLTAAFPEVDLYWLLHGTGSFPPKASPSKSAITAKKKKVESNLMNNAKKEIDHMVIFYTDGTFKSYRQE